ncbi:GNAT family N-acetyltransferase [Rubrobacter aplysinae]|uniref:GNAT family N-acetyltransferase n=1 Tax=Rubrobacter aplysinae TaxID=909625 RepID=UPI00064C177D|nr:GNAT family N-acetyltransferase [Rubrobacter aplysinae]
MRIRGYEKDDQAALGRVISLAFGGTDAGGERYLDPGHNRRLDPDLVYVAEEDGAPRATAAELPMQVHLDGRAVPMGGVSGVATHPAYRRRRLARSLLERVLYGMRERGVHISMLAPFSHSFYRASGYELAGEAIAYDLSPADLPTSPEQSHVRAHREADLPAMKHMLEMEAASHRLCIRRGESRWHEILENPAPVDEDDEAKESAVYERDGAVEGYLLYRHRKRADSGERTRILEIPELVAGTQRAREALISFMAAYDPLEWRVRYQTPPGEPLHPFLQSSYVRATIEPEKMLRLVDVEGALSYLSRPVPEPLVLEVTDDAIPENAGAYTVGEGNVLRGAAAPERVALDVRQLAQLYAGYLSAQQLHRRGLVTPGSGHALDLLDAIFPPADPWVFPLDRF